MFDVIEIVGLCAGFCTTFSIIPQITKIVTNRSTKDISYMMYFMNLIGNIFWISYAVSKSSTALVISSSLTFCLLGSVVVLKYIWDRELRLEE